MQKNADRLGASSDGRCDSVCQSNQTSHDIQRIEQGKSYITSPAVAWKIWHKNRVTEVTRRAIAEKFGLRVQTQIVSPSIRYFVTVLRFVDCEIRIL